MLHVFLFCVTGDNLVLQLLYSAMLNIYQNLTLKMMLYFGTYLYQSEDWV